VATTHPLSLPEAVIRQRIRPGEAAPRLLPTRRAGAAGLVPRSGTRNAGQHRRRHHVTVVLSVQAD
jgi:hypothetical protein